MGYSRQELEALRQTINAAPVDAVVAATPVDLAALMALNKPLIRARYEFAELDQPGLAGVLYEFLDRKALPPGNPAAVG